MDTNTKAKLVCDPSGKPILFECLGSLNRCIDLVNEHLDYELSHEQIDSHCHGMVPNPELRQRVLSIPERASIATLAWYCREYGAGLKLGEAVTMPIVNIAADDIECGFQDEGRAYAFAQVVETVFERNAQVVSNASGWTVVVGSPDVPLNGETLAQLRGACQVLMSYTIGDYDDVFGGNTAHEVYPDPAAREAWHDRKNTQQQRIEDGINAILAHLGHPAASADAHTLSASKSSSASKEKASGKKPSGKEKAKAGA